MIKVVIDAFGGDNAPNEVIKGVIKAINEDNNICVVLSGNEETLRSLLKEYSYNESQIIILNATDVIENNESPTMAIRQKKDSSLVVALEYAKENDDCVGLISAGSTGAVLTGAFMKFGRMEGIHRPALCPLLPTVNDRIVSICDCGANMDCKPEYLEQFAIMGSAYLSTLGIKKPKVALLNVGTEDHKGDVRSKDTFALLKENKKINFVGNMEARDLLSGMYDLVVTDGFAGNVLLKSTEGAMKGLLGVIKKEVTANFVSKIGACFLKKAFKKVKSRFDYSKYGGAVLLGCKKLVVKAHGSSKAESFYACINQMKAMATGKLLNKISKNLENVGLDK